MSDIPEALVGTVSGTIGDTVYGRNQFGPWTRPVNTPFDPMTTEQKLADDPLPWPEHEPFPVDSE